MMEFTILGQPRPQQRHRQVQKGKTRFAYDPSAKEKKAFLAKASKYAPSGLPPEYPLTIVLKFCFQRPKKHYYTGKRSKIIRENAPFWHTSTPDIDNLIKFVSDALNGVFWGDDKQICEISACKHYTSASNNKGPYTKIKVRAL